MRDIIYSACRCRSISLYYAREGLCIYRTMFGASTFYTHRKAKKKISSKKNLGIKRKMPGNCIPLYGRFFFYKPKYKHTLYYMTGINYINSIQHTFCTYISHFNSILIWTEEKRSCRTYLQPQLEKCMAFFVSQLHFGPSTKSFHNLNQLLAYN